MGRKGFKPKCRSMVHNSIRGRPIMAVGSSERMDSIKAMPRLSALALRPGCGAAA